ncbi:hypothetical protein ZIOFF_038181 [Zingiber officinale]|uniref:Uncharacterized protein n=1 Tax=Zingiber officinale TaxID=94328 RepID=A0A8J5GCI3_ZINOF|nr:hypothetical protein ZIOFF_038181 [Zingiber officinale]
MQRKVEVMLLQGKVEPMLKQPINFKYALAIGTALAVGHYSRFEFPEKKNLSIESSSYRLLGVKYLTEDSCTFELGNFCETYHSDDGGWRKYETCGKRLLALEVEADLRDGRRWRGRQHGKRERSKASDQIEAAAGEEIEFGSMERGEGLGEGSRME